MLFWLALFGGLIFGFVVAVIILLILFKNTIKSAIARGLNW